MRTEDLIVALAADARPVEVLAPMGGRLARWAVGALIGIGAAVVAFGLRSDLADVITNAWWLSEWGTVLVMAGMAAVAAQLSAVPGAAGTLGVRVLSIVALAAWGGLLARRLAGDGDPVTALLQEPVHLACALRMALVAAIPGAIAWRQVKRAAPLRPGWSGMLVALAALAVGGVATALVCTLDQPAHGLLWHVMPLLAMVATAGALAGSVGRR